MPVKKSSVKIIGKDFEPNNINDVLLKYRANIIESLRQNLIQLDKDQPGKLLQSIDIKITQRDSALVFTLVMEDYWKYVDEGRKVGSKMPPINALLEFIKVRGIKPKSLKQVKGRKKTVNRDKALKQVAFAIGKTIKKKGIKPTYFFSDVVNEQLYEQMKLDIDKALGRDIQISFEA